MLLDERNVKNLEMLIEIIDSKKIKKKKEKLVMSGNVIDTLFLIKKYNLQPTTHIQTDNYKLFKLFPCCEKNEFAVGPVSMYGDIVINLDIDGLRVQITQSPRTNNESKFDSKMVKDYNNQKYVILDIETTGLNPLTDDIIQICIYESSQNKYVRYLPLEKKTTNTAREINRISDTTLKTKKPLTQLEVDNIIKQFNLKDKIVMIWAGQNLFDRVFLEVYFKEHNLVGLDNFTFFNAKTLLNEFKNEIEIKSFSKDNIAYLYGLDFYNAHDALADCKIEKEIICNILSKNIEPLKANVEKGLIEEIKQFFKELSFGLENFNDKKDFPCRYTINNYKTANRLYFEFCHYLNYKNGIVLNDYDRPHKKRGDEWIDIHHVDEWEIDNIATRTQVALQNNDKKELKLLSKYNHRSRLVYATKVEHFVLHLLIDIIRGLPAGGTHYTFGDIVKINIGKFDNDEKFKKIQYKKSEFFKWFSFDELKEMYIINCISYRIYDIRAYCDDFWATDKYDYLKTNYKSLVSEINRRLKINKKSK